jgi:hypothetical protein
MGVSNKIRISYAHGPLRNVPANRGQSIRRLNQARE